MDCNTDNWIYLFYCRTSDYNKDDILREEILEYPKDYVNKVICGDCLEAMKGIPNNLVDLVITSPPYNIGIDYDCWDDRMDWEDYFKWCKEWLKEIYRILKEDGRFCLNHYLSFGSGRRGFNVGKKKGTEQGEDTGNGIRISPLMDLNYIAVKELDFKHHSVAIWQDITLSRKTAWGSWMSASSPYINSPFEGVLILYKKYWKKKNKGKSTIEKDYFIKATRGIWDIGTDKKRLTKATFPEKLPNLCINLLTYEDDIVFDPFMGSGTTAVVCKKLKRRYIGIEISPEYCQIARNRIKSIPESLF